MKIATGERACCPPLTEGPLGADDADRLAATLRAVAEPARLQLLSLIASRPGGETCVCELVEPLGLSQPTVSHHLAVLHGAGLIERERRGRWVYYRLVPAMLDELRTALAPPPARARRR